MNQEKFGKFIKALRKKHNLTQKQLADKYNVTYQAVSKWENGLNMPDTSLIRQISEDFGVSLEELFDGEYKDIKKNNNKIIYFCIGFIIIGIVILTVVLLSGRGENFKFNTLSSNCKNFNISGNIAYNDSKSAIYITNIKYCGGDDTEEYKALECSLYESNNDTEIKISSYKYEENKNIKLEDFLQQVTLSVDDYTKTCKEYKDNSLYLLVNATREDNKVITYKIPLKLESSCSKD